MRIEPLGETAFILRNLEVEPHVLARSIELAGVPGVDEIVPSMETVGLYVDPDVFDPEKLMSLKLVNPGRGRNFLVPVFFDGPDLAEIAQILQVEPEFLIKIFCDQTYTIVAIGFQPGFPYMKGLPESMLNIPRRSEPRISVSAGSVGIAAGQAGIYPQDSPGGWNLLGTTPLQIADKTTQFFPLSPCDTVKFVEIDKAERESLQNKTILDYAHNRP
ncbi:MAG: carboxyltransferase domain-containing protein [Armatimonadetes bacterium]|nr:carboxyltransferase domain-containing protein [Armatimonadota bacterium]MBS1727813.1 allophanate hydrolase subunit 1 [Armatimonadota bacterium]